MSTPAGNPGGDTTTPVAAALADLPARIRVHALAKLLGRSSREVLAAVTQLGADGRSVQSSIDRELALRVAEALGVTAAEPTVESPEAVAPQATGVRRSAGSPGFSEPPAVQPPTQESSTRVTPPTPVFASASPLFLPPEPVAAQQRPAKPKEEPEPVVEDEVEETEDAFAEETDEGRPRRRRGRRGRGRGKGGQDEPGDDIAEEEPKPDKPDKTEKADKPGRKVKAEAEPAEAADEDEPADGEDSASRRRRRRRRRRGGDGDEPGGNPTEDDPPNTVVHVREARDDKEKPESDGRDEVRSVRGSTRLEAKRQRRRDGREAGRRRAPILSEAEFLARREAVDRAMVIRERGDRIQIGVLEDGVLVEHFVTSSGGGSLVGNVYLGRVQNVLPSMEAAFVDIGRGRNAVLYAGEVDWDAAGLEGKARKIEQALSTGDSVLVQVTKDPVGHKGARLTTQISLPGRFLVYVPGGGATGISRKLPENERRRLKDVLKRVVPEDAGVIIRTASEGISEEELARDVRRLQAQWQVIRDKTEGTNGVRRVNAPSLVYEEPDLLVKVVRDLFTEDFSALVIQGDTAWQTVDAYVSHVAPELADRLRKHVTNTDVFAEYRIDEQLLKALDRKVWLPSGGYLVIDRTEAMTVIDVNTGKFTGSGGNLEETVTRNNLESAEEIVRQLRLRDIGGIIVIDFIDMVLESNRDLVLRRLTECLGRDRTRHQVAEVTSLGLVQMTRKRVGTGLLEAFGTTCEHCKGRGVLVSTEPVSKPNGNGSGNGESTRGGTRRSRGRNDEPKDKPVNKDAAKEAAAQAAKEAVRDIAKATMAGPEHPADAADPEPAKTEEPAKAAEPEKAEEPTRGERHRHRTRARHRGESRNGRAADTHEHANGATHTPERSTALPESADNDVEATTPTGHPEPAASAEPAHAESAGQLVGAGQTESVRSSSHTGPAAPAESAASAESAGQLAAGDARQAESAPSIGHTEPAAPASASSAESAPAGQLAEAGQAESVPSSGHAVSTAPGESAAAASSAASAPAASATPSHTEPAGPGESATASAESARAESTTSTSHTEPGGPAESASAGSADQPAAGGAGQAAVSAISATPAESAAGQPALAASSEEATSEPSSGFTSTPPWTAQPATSAEEATDVPAPATPPRRQPRRAASRPAGPPVSARHDG